MLAGLILGSAFRETPNRTYRDTIPKTKWFSILFLIKDVIHPCSPNLTLPHQARGVFLCCTRTVSAFRCSCPAPSFNPRIAVEPWFITGIDDPHPHFHSILILSYVHPHSLGGHVIFIETPSSTMLVTVQSPSTTLTHTNLNQKLKTAASCAQLRNIRNFVLLL